MSAVAKNNSTLIENGFYSIFILIQTDTKSIAKDSLQI